MRQAIMDLYAAAERQPLEAIYGIDALIPPADRAHGANATAVNRLIRTHGGRLCDPKALPLRDALMLAASQPEIGTAAFACATAVLLADRLQHGKAEDADDLGVYWDILRPAYLDLDPSDRSAILQGFLAGARAGLIRCSGRIPEKARLTRQTAEVRQALLRVARHDASGLLALVSERVGHVDCASVFHLRALLTDDAPDPLTGDDALFPPLLDAASRRGHRWMPAATALLLAEALRASDVEGWFAVTLWHRLSHSWMHLGGPAGRAIAAGLRHIYEVDPDWAPLPDAVTGPSGAQPQVLLPAPDAAGLALSEGR